MATGGCKPVASRSLVCPLTNCATHVDIAKDIPPSNSKTACNRFADNFRKDIQSAVRETDLSL